MARSPERGWLVVVMVAMVASTAIAFQTSTDDIQKAFEAGAHERVVAAARRADDPTALCLAGLSQVELDHIPEAREKLEQLAARPADDARPDYGDVWRMNSGWSYGRCGRKGAAWQRP